MKVFKSGDRVRNLVEFEVPGGIVPKSATGIVISQLAPGDLYDVDWDAPVSSDWVQLAEEMELA